MKQTFDLNKMGLAPMGDLEMQEIDGGWNWYQVGAIAFGTAAIFATGGMAAAAMGAYTACVFLS